MMIAPTTSKTARGMVTRIKRSQSTFRGPAAIRAPISAEKKDSTIPATPGVGAARAGASGPPPRTGRRDRIVRPEGLEVHPLVSAVRRLGCPGDRAGHDGPGCPALARDVGERIL